MRILAWLSFAASAVSARERVAGSDPLVHQPGEQGGPDDKLPPASIPGRGWPGRRDRLERVALPLQRSYVGTHANEHVTECLQPGAVAHRRAMAGDDDGAVGRGAQVRLRRR